MGDGYVALRSAPDPAGPWGYAPRRLERRGVLPDAPVEQAAGNQRKSSTVRRWVSMLLPADTITNTAGRWLVVCDTAI